MFYFSSIAAPDTPQGRIKGGGGGGVSAFSGQECWTGVLDCSTGVESLEWSTGEHETWSYGTMH